jgi:hypothetical protein
MCSALSISIHRHTSILVLPDALAKSILNERIMHPYFLDKYLTMASISGVFELDFSGNFSHRSRFSI